MADNVEFSITGVEALSRKLTTIPLQVSKKPGRRALGKGATLVARAARKKARSLDDPSTSESIARNIAQRFDARHFRRTGELKIKVGVRGGARQYGNTRQNRRLNRVGKSYETLGSKGNPGGDTWYWRFLEFGTSRSRAQPFLRPALSENIQEVVNKVATELSRELDKLAEQGR